MIDIQRTDGHWGDGTRVCSACGSRQATKTSQSGAPLCVQCDEERRMTTKSTASGKVKRIFDAMVRKVTGGDAEKDR